jgi:pimeloyl-ACP methyl ester carboxylesterase
MTTHSLYKSPVGQQAVMAFYDKMLAGWPVPFESQTIPTRHGDTFVLACGRESNPPLMLLHGSTSNSLTWGGDVTEFTRYFRVYAPDIPGEPGKSAPNRFAWDGPAPVEWLADVYEGLQIECAHLVGMSLGSWISLRFAIERPQQVHKLVVLCPGGLAPMKVSFILKVIPLSLLGRRGVARTNEILFANEPVPDVIDEFSYLLVKNFNGRRDPLPILSDEQLQHVTAPTLLLVGGLDAMLDSEKTVARMLANVPNLTATLLPDVGHVLINVTESILSFLAPGDPD